MFSGRIFEASCFIVMALSLHVAAAAVLQSGAGATPGDPGLPPGSGFAVGSAGLQEMVDGWDVAPDIQASAEQPQPEIPEQTGQETLPAELFLPQPDPAPQPVPTVAGVSPVKPNLPEPAEPQPVVVQPELPELRNFQPPEIVTGPTPVLTASEHPRRRPDGLRPRTEQKAKASGKAKPGPDRARGQPARSQSAQASGNGGRGLPGPGQSDLAAQWRKQIFACLAARMPNPRTLRRSGVVELGMTILRNGTVQGIRIIGSSGDASLDQVAIRAAKRVRRCPAAPAGFRGESYNIRLPIELVAG